MATKAELETELAALRSELASRPEPPSEPSPGTAPDGEADTAAAGFNPVKKILAEKGIDGSDVEAFLTQLSDELGALPENKPILTAVGAFALGFLAGRMTK